jgi:hypothetical protein
MATFITIHRSPGLSAEEIEGNAPAVAESELASFRHLYAAMFDGFIVTLYEAEDLSAVESEFERIGFPWDEIHEVNFQVDDAGLRQMLVQGNAS